jgi:hypothetical protein
MKADFGEAGLISLILRWQQQLAHLMQLVRKSGLQVFPLHKAAPSETILLSKSARYAFAALARPLDPTVD